MNELSKNDSDGDGGEKQTVKLDEILEAEPAKETTAQELHPLQKVGFKLAIWVFAYIIVASVIIFYVSFWRFQLPASPSAPGASDPEHYKQQLDSYRMLLDAYQQTAKAQVERATQLFQLVVASTILPAFTAILGYIFASKKAGE